MMHDARHPFPAAGGIVSHAFGNKQAKPTLSCRTWLNVQAGFSRRNRNDLGASIQRIMQDQQGYYLIGFRPEEIHASLQTEPGVCTT